MTDAFLLPAYGYIYFVDLEREAEINIGTSWSTDLAPNECILSSDYQQNYDVTVGKQVAYGANLMYLW